MLVMAKCGKLNLMALLEVSGLSMAYAEKTLYDDADLELQAGEHMGIVGQNGAGKSTLIRILTGQVLPLSGRIDWAKNLKIGYLDQYAEIPEGMTLVDFLHTAYKDLYDKQDRATELYEKYAATADDKLLERAGRLQEELDAAGFYDVDTEIERVISGLGLEAIGRDRELEHMSGGQRAKVILAKLLLENDDVIILDEPTNYLDVSHIEWLEGFLQGFEGAAMIISHDFDFLDKVTNAIADVSFGKITKYRGSFQKAMRQKEERSEQQMRQYEKQQVEIAKAEKFIAKNKARASTSKQAKSREKMLARMDKVDPPSENLKAKFNFPYVNSQSAAALTVTDLSVGYEQAILEPVSFSLTTEKKIVFAGFNGAGKSTLIKSILGEIPSLGGQVEFSPSAVVNYFDQDLDWDNDQQTPLQAMQDLFPTILPKELRQRLAGAGINAENAQKPLFQLSGGEQTKVKLAIMEMKPSNFLILDEPTNHLDEETKQALYKAIKAFPGNAIIVSHEVSFTKDLADQTLNVAALSYKENPE
ncbi:ATPase components of ABC transporters with duplicated ATPase domains (Uup) [Fructobacillus tropaeoli]|uniref:ABC transporter ATPase n=2 Tax=Lactobacillaceae TaxID=33958 RepID=A0A3F3HGH9_9LACO|nr:ABC transporter ATPase [Fructobacillus tropaeoli]CAK1248529.1 ATPase components of ABC transporters with duplicated ATPase domains (Uup) [Fructobacillus tropaeoli]CAK1252782.1 ATPase components of ABC transporters with duplicated ATPase domains (Uup) [Fructobacillus tropaeoli]CAK1252859.1 ATPase components of ABC transporters with duplicated ATPase domains (Uup) [Fructobacillus tropaeoli]